VCVRLVVWALDAVLLPTQKIYDGPGTSLHWLRRFGAGQCPASTASLLAFVGALAGAALALRWMTGAASRPWGWGSQDVSSFFPPGGRRRPLHV
jgi:hypothetical protein